MCERVCECESPCVRVLVPREVVGSGVPPVPSRVHGGPRPETARGARPPDPGATSDGPAFIASGASSGSGNTPPHPAPPDPPASPTPAHAGPRAQWRASGRAGERRPRVRERCGAPGPRGRGGWHDSTRGYHRGAARARQRRRRRRLWQRGPGRSEASSPPRLPGPPARPAPPAPPPLAQRGGRRRPLPLTLDPYAGRREAREGGDTTGRALPPERPGASGGISFVLPRGAYPRSYSPP